MTELESLISTKYITHLAEGRRLMASLRDLKGSAIYAALVGRSPAAQFTLIHTPTKALTNWTLCETWHNEGGIIGWEFALKDEIPEIKGYTLFILND